MHDGWNDPRSPYYRQGCDDGDEGRDYMRFANEKCENCRFFKNMGPNMVPYGDTSVNEGDVWECGKGFDPGDCQAEDFERRERRGRWR